MSSPPNFLFVTAWFARLDSAWRRMPADERTHQREEIEQHLEGLVAANVAQGQPLEDAWEAALIQFGDPAQIGRKMYQEWQQNQSSFRMDMKAILFGCGLCVVQFVGRETLVGTSHLFAPHVSNNSHFIFGLSILLYVSSVLIYIAIGRKYPFQAIRSAFYIYGIGWCWEMIGLASMLHHHPNIIISPGAWIAIASLEWLPSVVIAYLASVTKRGWYRPTLADFKITPPFSRFKIAR